jgi:hypothetical protein
MVDGLCWSGWKVARRKAQWKTVVQVLARLTRRESSNIGFQRSLLGRVSCISLAILVVDNWYYPKLLRLRQLAIQAVSSLMLLAHTMMDAVMPSSEPI